MKSRKTNSDLPSEDNIENLLNNPINQVSLFKTKLDESSLLMPKSENESNGQEDTVCLLPGRVYKKHAHFIALVAGITAASATISSTLICILIPQAKTLGYALGGIGLTGAITLGFTLCCGTKNAAESPDELPAYVSSTSDIDDEVNPQQSTMRR